MDVFKKQIEIIKRNNFEFFDPKNFSEAFDKVKTDKKILIELNKVDDNIQPLLKKKNVYSGNIQLIRLKGTVTSGTTTITIKGYQDADGNGIMNYSVPTNYRCLCTKGLNQ